MAAVMGVGCIAVPGFVHAASAAETMRDGQQKPSKKVEKQVSAAERAVAKSPQDATVRVKLGQSYLAAGRFVSAGATFEDAVALGDKAPATALGMALSYIATGRNAEAAALLGQWGDSIPASDHGLALALAGQPLQAIAVLGEAIKQGENTPKIRQNLAYAYALAGRLPEARVIAAQDIPADKLETRVSEWALAASIGSQQSRVAALLGAPVRSDPGRPAQLAVAAPLESPSLATNDVTSTPGAMAELPALGTAAPMLVQAAYQPTPASHAAPAAAEPAAVPRSPEIADIAEVMRRYDAKSTAQATPRPALAAVRARQERKTAAAKSVAKAAASKPAPAVSTGSHLVQLGSFTSEAGAHRAWNIFVSRDPSLKGRELRITQAMVNGRRYFRVAAAGYEAAEARTKCSSLKGRGSDCLAYASRGDSRGSRPAKVANPLLARR
jgi:tetratricopeptide (TPR) repeat protein